jgi:hypothetical protein
MIAWVEEYIRDRDGNYIPWMFYLDYYASCVSTATVWTIDLYRYFPRSTTTSKNNKEECSNSDSETKHREE